MGPTQFIDWRCLPPDSAETLRGYNPYDGATVLICHQRRIFEAFWATKKDPEFRKEIAATSGAEGHWLSLHDRGNPFGLGQGQSLASTYWAPVPDAPDKNEDLRKQYLTLGTEGFEDLALLIELPDWVQATYRPDIDGWVDIFGQITPHVDSLQGIVVNLPRAAVPKTAIIKSNPNQIWG